jgi:hypothetical protein
MAGFAEQNVSAPLRQTRFEDNATDRIGDRLADAFEHPAMIEQHKHQPDACVARSLERGVHISEEMWIESGRETAIVVEDAAAAVSKDEPSDDGKAERRHS